MTDSSKPETPEDPEELDDIEAFDKAIADEIPGILWDEVKKSLKLD